MPEWLWTPAPAVKQGHEQQGGIAAVIQTMHLVSPHTHAHVAFGLRAAWLFMQVGADHVKEKGRRTTPTPPSYDLLTASYQHMSVWGHTNPNTMLALHVSPC